MDARVDGRPVAGVSRQGRDEARAGQDRAASQGSRQAHNGARHLEKSRGLLCQGVDVKFGVVAKHRGTWPANLNVRGARCLAKWPLCLDGEATQPA